MGSIEYHVFRVALVPIVLTLAIGHDPLLLCRAWCDLAAAATTGCHDKDVSTSPSVTRNDDCGRVALNGAVLIRDDPGRQGARHPVVLPRYQFPSSMREAQHRRELGRASPPESRPLVIALRI
jgi:hypothetical protein